MAGPLVTNWFGDLVSHPQVIVDAFSAEDVARVLRDPAGYPAPVRAVGSNHSTAPCGVAEGGTLIRMRMDRILRITGDSITVEAGAHHLAMARELQARGLQFYVNTEIGSLTAGSAACAGTKDSSFVGQYGQVGSYITAMKLVLPSGEILAADEAGQPELMKLLRSSYGIFGIVTEVTYRVRPLTPMKVYHETFTLADFLARLPELKARGEAMMYYAFPFDDRVTVEFRRDNPAATGEPNRAVWQLRNYLWGTAGPKLARDAEANIPIPAVRYEVIDGFNALIRFKLETIIQADHTLPPDQIIDYPAVSNDSRYTFSLFAFPEDEFPKVFSEFFAFVRRWYDEQNYRSNLLYVGYRIAQDQQALLS